MQSKSLLVVSFSFKFLLFYSHFAFHFIACNFFFTFRGRVAPSQLIVNLINYRNEDKQRCNMLLLMLVVSLSAFSNFLKFITQGRRQENCKGCTP